MSRYCLSKSIMLSMEHEENGQEIETDADEVLEITISDYNSDIFNHLVSPLIEFYSYSHTHNYYLPDHWREMTNPKTFTILVPITSQNVPVELIINIHHTEDSYLDGTQICDLNRDQMMHLSRFLVDERQRVRHIRKNRNVVGIFFKSLFRAAVLLPLLILFLPFYGVLHIGKIGEARAYRTI